MALPVSKALPPLVLCLGLLLCSIPVGEQWPCVAEARGGAFSWRDAGNSLDQLARLSCPQLEQLFAQAPAAPLRVGFARGSILVLSGRPFPEMSRKVAGLIWRGKHFQEDGTFVNQWAGFRAIRSEVTLGPSYYDGKPSLLLEYPKPVPYFGKMRDEVREIAPGLCLCMVFEKSSSPKFRGFIGLQFDPQEDSNPVAPPAPVVSMAEQVPAPRETISPDGVVELIVELPADAKLYVNDKLMKTTSERRVFNLPQLEPGSTYYYILRAETVRNGRSQSESKAVFFHPGESIRTSFHDPGEQAVSQTQTNGGQ
jgi:uncharacterized protein (TIGR03000 family)